MLNRTTKLTNFSDSHQYIFLIQNLICKETLFVSLFITQIISLILLKYFFVILRRIHLTMNFKP